MLMFVCGFTLFHRFIYVRTSFIRCSNPFIILFLLSVLTVMHKYIINNNVITKYNYTLSSKMAEAAKHANVSTINLINLISTFLHLNT